MSKPSALSTIHMHVMWNRLISVVEEQAQALIRTAFSLSLIHISEPTRPY